MDTKVIRVLNRWTVEFPDFIADWDVWDYWEAPRFHSIAANLKVGDTLFDIGSEWGSLSAIYAQIVGPDNMCLFEPNPWFWSTIRLIWQINGYPNPRSCFVGLLSNCTDLRPPSLDYNSGISEGWPICSYQLEIPAQKSYRYIHEQSHAEATLQTRLDLWVNLNHIRPKAITIDVEGAEFLVLSGAKHTIRNYRPLVWVSVHPDLMARDYQSHPTQVFEFFNSLCYVKYFLHVDHEEHYFFYPEEYNPVL